MNLRSTVGRRPKVTQRPTTFRSRRALRCTHRKNINLGLESNDPNPKDPFTSELRRSATPSTFFSAKTNGPVPVENDLVHQALVQATLDPCVDVIEYVPEVRSGRSKVKLDAIVIVKQNGRFALDASPDLPLAVSNEVLEKVGLTRLFLKAAEIRRAPRANNALRIWSMHNFRVPVFARMQILAILEESADAPIATILRALSNDFDGQAALFSLLCSNVIVVDIEATDLSEAKVRRTA
jgi:hypothetical protein